jgi:predicted nuclease of predicted toxin-antitoxin system
MIKFYSNENFPINLVNCLRNFGYDILTSYEAGNANQGIDDENVLNFAHQNQRVVITLNREDFISLHKQNIPHSGIIICKEDPDYQGQAHLIHQFILNDQKPLTQRLIRIKKRNQKGSSVQIFVIQEHI